MIEAPQSKGLISSLFKITLNIFSIKAGFINPSISTTLEAATLPFEKIIAWSSRVKVSLKLPCPLLASISKASFSNSIFSIFKI